MQVTQHDIERREGAVEVFLLQQHRTLLTRLTVTRISYRIIDLVILGYLLAVNIPTLGLIISVLVTYIVALTWVFEEKSMVRQLSTIEKTLARETGGNWEDIYIQTRYEVRNNTSSFLYFVFKSEPFFWFLVTAILLSFQIVKSFKG